MTNELDADQALLYAKVPDDGQTIGNLALKAALGWDTDQYYAVRDSLVDAGLIARGRGRGGTVRRNVAPPTIENVGPQLSHIPGAIERIEEVATSEAGLYDPMRAVINGDWAKDHRSKPIAVEITALQGRRTTGGAWSRPDIVSVEVRTFPYVPGKYLKIVTFEVKPPKAAGVLAVYEALAHRRSATNSYVLLHIPPEEAVALESVIEEVVEVARSHGIGVVIAGDPGEYQTWDERVEAERVEPDPERLNDFIRTQLSAATCQLLAERLR